MKNTIKKAQNGAKTKDSTAYFRQKEYLSELKALTATNKPEMDKQFNEKNKAKLDRLRQSKKGKPGYDANGNPLKKQKTGGKTMLKRADGSVSQRGLWDNIRANKGSGKKPTAQMLKQERKIKANSKKK